MKVLDPVKVLVSERSVEDAAVIVPEAPRETDVPLMVMDEFARPAFVRVPVIDGAKVKVPPVLVMVRPRV